MALSEEQKKAVETFDRNVLLLASAGTGKTFTLANKVAEGMINISANTAPIFEDGASEGNLMLVNESINNYPQKVQIVRNDTGEQIYESGAIAVGSKIERAKLDVVLPAGTYECTAYFHNLNPETGDIIGTAGAIITITIKN